MRLPWWLGIALLPGASAAPLFVDAAAEVGLDFEHAGFRAGPGRESLAFYEATAGGACWGDYDRDGDVDVYITDFLDAVGNGASRLFRNDAGTFVDVSEASGARLVGVGQGCAWGDYDNDGWRDLYVTFAVTPFASQGNALLRNQGDGTFRDVTARAGVDGRGETPCEPEGRCWSVGAAWLDHDLDGDLDLYVAHYAVFPFGTCIHEFRGSPLFCRGQANRLYQNQGDGTFRDVASRLGVALNGQPTGGRSLGVIATDIDGDAWPDIYVANDKDANALYLNNRDGTFRSAASVKGVDNFGPLEARAPDHRAGMGVDAQDYDDDGFVDLLSTHLAGEFDGVYHNLGGFWEDLGDRAPVDQTAYDVSRWGGGFVDLDLDGYKDLLVVAGGQVRAEPGPIHLYLGDGTWFTPAPDWTFLHDARANHRGAAFADFDDDGDVDVLVTALPGGDGTPGRAKLLRSLAADGGGRSVRVDLSRDVVGAHVVVRTDDGRVRHAWTVSGGSYANDHDPRTLVGVGNATAGTVAVQWPGGAWSQPVPFTLDERGRAFVRIDAPLVAELAQSAAVKTAPAPALLGALLLALALARRSRR